MKKIFVSLTAFLLIAIMSISAFTAAADVLLLGDADCDGEVSSIDATVIQRVLACIMDAPDDGFYLRADVDRSEEVDIVDVTFIQRYLALMDIPYPIDQEVTEEYFSQDPTQPPTQAPTQPGTQPATSARDPYELPPV